MTKKKITEANIIKKNTKKEVNKVLRKIKRRKIYENEEYERKITTYRQTHNMTRKGAEKRLESYAKKESTKKKYQPTDKPVGRPKGSIKDITPKKYKQDRILTTIIQGENAGTQKYIKIDESKYNRDTLKQIEILQARANKRAKEAGLNYKYNFHFGSKEGAEKYLNLLEKINSNNDFFIEKAEARDKQFIENIKSSYNAVIASLTDEEDIKEVNNMLTQLESIKTREQARNFYLKLNDKYDIEQLSAYIFSSTGTGSLLDQDIEAMEAITKIIGGIE